MTAELKPCPFCEGHAMIELENGMCRLEPELEAAIFKNTEGLYEGDGIEAIPRLYTEIGIEAAIAAAMMGAVKPLDLSNVLKHAFKMGWSAAKRGGLVGESWVEYDPTDNPAYQRILSALSIPTDAAATLAERDKRVADVLKYAGHTRRCNLSSAFIDGNDCTCGFDAAIRAMKGGA